MRTTLFTRAVAVSALLAVSSLSTAAYAGEKDRAKVAIAEAQAKVDAADKIGASGEAAETQSRARAALETARVSLARSKERQAINDAHRASELADLAISATERNKAMATRDERAGRLDAEASAAAAQQAAANANASAADANLRAASSQQAAAMASAEASALRNATPAVTTVQTTEQVIAAKPATRKVVRTKARPAVKKTTTTVTTQ